jgi:hypothetical protein
MKAFAPVIGAKPSAGVLLGAAGNVAFYRGESSTTHISSSVASVTVPTMGQVAIADRLAMFTRDDLRRVDGAHRFQWTSQSARGAPRRRTHCTSRALRPRQARSS